MQRSGIVRKLDDVGRIVIPKEIRNYLKLEEGSPLEIGINNIGEVVLSSAEQKYTISDFAKLLGQGVSELIHSQIIFTDDKSIIIAYGCEYTGRISASVNQIIEDNKTYFASIQDKTTILPIVQDLEICYNSQIIIPYKNESLCGCIIAISQNKSIDLNHVKMLEFLVRLLEKVCR